MAYMKPFNSTNPEHLEWARRLPFSHSTCLPYLDYFGNVFTRHGSEPIFVWQHEDYVHTIPSIVLPKLKRNWENAAIAFATQEDLQKIRAEGIPILREEFVGTEYFYKTQTFLEPDGKLAKKIRKFVRDYPTVQIVHTLDPKAVKAFYQTWKNQQRKPSESKAEVMTERFDVRDAVFDEDHEFFHYCLDHLDRYQIKQVYALLDGKPVGMAWGVEHSPGKWIGLHLKADYQVTGLSRFLQHERAKLFAHCDEVSLSTGCGKAGLDAFKQELGPAYTKEYWYVVTGERQKPTPPKTA